MSRAGDIVRRFCESDFDDEDMFNLSDRIVNQQGQQAKDVVGKAFGSNPEPGPVTDNIRVGQYKTPRSQRSIASMSPEAFQTLLSKLDRDAYHHPITPQWARQIALRLGDTGKLPRLGYECTIGKIEQKPLENDPEGIWGTSFDVVLAHDAHGYRITLHRSYG